MIILMMMICIVFFSELIQIVRQFFYIDMLDPGTRKKNINTSYTFTKSILIYYRKYYLSNEPIRMLKLYIRNRIHLRLLFKVNRNRKKEEDLMAWLFAVIFVCMCVGTRLRINTIHNRKLIICIESNSIVDRSNRIFF